VHPQSANQDLYLAAVLAGFELMGPAEKTSNASALLRAFRHPLPFISAPYSLGPQLLKGITDSASEVAGAAYAFRDDVVHFLDGPSGILTPQDTVSRIGNIEQAPGIYIPQNLAFYPAL